ncbi:MAG: pilus assembly protein PilP [Pseudomonadota bacterium]
MTSIKIAGRALLLIMACLLLSACSSDHVEDLRQYVNDTKARNKGKIDPMPQIAAFVPYPYDAEGRRDPFSPTTAKSIQSPGTVNTSQIDSNRAREPLEAFPLDALKMVGTLQRGGERWAIIKATDGNVYWAKQGNHLGQSNGKITTVSETKVELIEIISDGIGGWQENPVSLVMAE